MRKSAILLIIIPLLFSCKPNYKDKILGEWKFVKYDYKVKQSKDGILIPPPIEYIGGSGYSFLKNGICENKDGYIDYSGCKLFKRFITQYQIDGDSLKIFDLRDKLGQKSKILSISKDTMLLQIDNSSVAKYVRYIPNKDTLIKLDQIIVSSSGCYGSCPINNIALDKSGCIIYCGEHYNLRNGYYTSKIDTNQYKQIQTSFLKANIIKLKTEYQSGWTDDETISVTIIKDNRILKTVSDYGRAAPADLKWCYTPIRYLYQKLNLDTAKKNLVEMHNFKFLRKNKICVLQKSESFYLWTLLREAREINKPVVSDFKMAFYNDDKLTTVKTDGQLFEFTSAQGKKCTYDIGFNFIEKNPDIVKFKDKTEYD